MALDEEDIIALVREECGQPPITEVSDELMASFYDAACASVNIAMGRSVAKIGEITTEENVSRYDLPDDCARVIRLYWGPAIPMITRTSRLQREPYDFDAVEVGEELQTSRRRRVDAFPFQWEVMDFGDGKKLVLGSAPSIGGSVIMFRYVAHSIDDMSIPDALADAVRERIKCEVFKTRHAYWASHEEISQAGSLSEARVDEFRRAAAVCEERYKAIIAERA